MTNKNIYVRDCDMAIWAEAEELARQDNLSMSAVVTSALRQVVQPNTEVVDRLDRIIELLEGIATAAP